MGEVPAGRLRARVTVTLEGPLRQAPAEDVLAALSRGVRLEDETHEIRLLRIEDVEVLDGGEADIFGDASGASFFDMADLHTLATRQGVRPVTDFEALLGDFWPEDESVDDFIAAVREWRRDGE